jgi:sugar phosphate isomerase/epimerase
MLFSLCNEVFGSRQTPDDWRQVCAFLAECGYQGVEVAPFTFAESVEEISAQARHEIRSVAADCGLRIVGLHWLLVSPPGLHLHARDEAKRRRTRDYLKTLIDFAGDLGAPVMVLGSNRQRALEDGDAAGAWSRTVATLGSLTAHLAARDVVLCPEALPAPDCDFLQTAAEAAQMVNELAHPQIRPMLDAKSLSAEPRPPAETIRALGKGIAHFHANDANRRAPGYGDTDFFAIAAALRDVEYDGFVSIEPFDYWPDPQTLARQSLAYLKSAFEEAE